MEYFLRPKLKSWQDGKWNHARNRLSIITALAARDNAIKSLGCPKSPNTQHWELTAPPHWATWQLCREKLLSTVLWQTYGLDGTGRDHRVRQWEGMADSSLIAVQAWEIRTSSDVLCSTPENTSQRAASRQGQCTRAPKRHPLQASRMTLHYWRHLSAALEMSNGVARVTECGPIWFLEKNTLNGVLWLSFPRSLIKIKQQLHVKIPSIMNTEDVTTDLQFKDCLEQKRITLLSVLLFATPISATWPHRQADVPTLQGMRSAHDDKTELLRPWSVKMSPRPFSVLLLRLMNLKQGNYTLVVKGANYSFFHLF